MHLSRDIITAAARASPRFHSNSRSAHAQSSNMRSPSATNNGPSHPYSPHATRKASRTGCRRRSSPPTSQAKKPRHCRKLRPRSSTMLTSRIPRATRRVRQIIHCIPRATHTGQRLSDVIAQSRATESESGVHRGHRRGSTCGEAVRTQGCEH